MGKADCRLNLLFCLFSCLGQGDSEYIDIDQSPAILEGTQIEARLAESFGRAGFANIELTGNKNFCHVQWVHL